jgi:ATP-dependent Clp protease ATP-binding subunit ClpA
MYPFERFTERAKKVLTLAQEEAERSHHSYIGTEHLLLGLLRVEEGVAAHALGSLGIELGRVRSAIDAVLGMNERIMIQQIIPTSRVKKVIELSFEESRRTGINHVGTEHLLLGLLIEGEGIAARVLQDLGVSVETARAAIARAYQEGPGARASEGGRPSPGAGGEPAGTWGPEWARGAVPGGPHPPSSSSGDPIAQEAERLAGEQHTSVGVEHALLAAIDTDPLIRRMLSILGVDDAKLAELRRIATPPPRLVEMRRAYEARTQGRVGYLPEAEAGELLDARRELDEAERRWRAGEDLGPEGKAASDPT